MAVLSSQARTICYAVLNPQGVRSATLLSKIGEGEIDNQWFKTSNLSIVRRPFEESRKKYATEWLQNGLSWHQKMAVWKAVGRLRNRQKSAAILERETYLFIPEMLYFVTINKKKFGFYQTKSPIFW